MSECRKYCIEHYSEKVAIKGNVHEKLNRELEKCVCGLEGHLVYQQIKRQQNLSLLYYLHKPQTVHFDMNRF